MEPWRRERREGSTPMEEQGEWGTVGACERDAEEVVTWKRGSSGGMVAA